MRQSLKLPAISIMGLTLVFLLLCISSLARSVSLELISSTVLNNFYDVCADETYAYCTTSFGLAILKIYDPKYPNPTSSIFLQDSAHQLQNNGNYVYIANGDEGLKVIDVTKRYRPEVVATCSTPGRVRAICIKDSLVYLGEDGSGIRIINAADPENPYITGSYDSPNSTFFAHNMVIKDSLIYAATESDCIEIVNVKNPATPVYAGTFCGATKPMSLAIVGDTLFVGDDSGDCLKIFDLSDPADPEFISSAASEYSEPYDICYYDEGYVFISDFRGISAFNIRNIVNPFFEGSYSSASGPSRLSIVNDYICYTTKSYGFYTVSIKPFLATAGRYVIPHYITKIDIFDTLAYLNTNWYGPVIANISDPANPHWVNNVLIMQSESGGDLDYYDGYLYYAYIEFFIIDVKDPMMPVLQKMIKEYAAPGEYFDPRMRDIAVHENHAYCRASIIYVYDISDPPNTHRINTISPSISTSSFSEFFIDSSTDFLYATLNYGPDIQIFDITDASQITRIGSFEHTYNTGIWPNRVHNILAKQDLAYFTVADTFFVMDVSDPANPEELGYYCCMGYHIHFVKIIDDLAFICEGTNIHVLDISDPYNLTMALYYPLPSEASAQDIYKVGDYLYVATYDSFKILKLITDPDDKAPAYGDCNFDGEINLTDVIVLINFLYSKEASPFDPVAADIDNSGVINLLDITYLIRHLFNDNPEREVNH